MSIYNLILATGSPYMIAPVEIVV